MFKLFIITEEGDDYLGDFTTLAYCDRATEIKLDIMHKKDGIKKARFYALDDKGVKAVTWILGVKEEW